MTARTEKKRVTRFTALCVSLLLALSLTLGASAAQAPAAPVSRGTFVSLLWEAMGKPAAPAAAAFSDVPGSAPYAAAVQWARAEQVTRGVTGTRFAPDDPLTREQLAVMLYRYAQSQGVGFQGMWMFPLPYTDGDAVGEWSYEAVCWTSMHKVVSGASETLLDPKSPVSREEAEASLAALVRELPVDYSDPDNWAWLDTKAENTAADVFFVTPTVYGGGVSALNMRMADTETKANFLGAANMEKGIYADNTRLFAPYYRQAGLAAYGAAQADMDAALDYAYQDVRAAFDYYMETYNNGRPIILAGFSQGADHCIRLIKDMFGGGLSDRLVACYAIGWRLTQEEVDAFPQLRAAQGEADTGVVVSFNSEAQDVTASLMVPSGTRTLGINPLNWKTDGTPADKTLNKGACFTDYSGGILKEVPALTGACLDPVRGTLKVSDVTPEEYPHVLDIFSPGIYHLYDYQFFYRNLKENVAVRLAAFAEKAAA